MSKLHRATPERLSAFSGGVFVAILITVLVLELHPTAFPTFKALLLLWHTWLSYAVSYSEYPSGQFPHIEWLKKRLPGLEVERLRIN